MDEKEIIDMEISRLNTLINIAKTGKDTLVHKRCINDAETCWGAINRMALQHVQYLDTLRRG